MHDVYSESYEVMEAIPLMNENRSLLVKRNCVHESPDSFLPKPMYGLYRNPAEVSAEFFIEPANFMTLG